MQTAATTGPNKFELLISTAKFDRHDLLEQLLKSFRLAKEAEFAAIKYRPQYKPILHHWRISFYRRLYPVN